MEGFTLVDAGSGIILLLSAILAYSRGFVREILSIAGWFVAAIVAFIFAPQVEPLIREVPILSDILGENCELSVIAAFFIVFAGTLIIEAIFTPLFAGAVQRSVLSGFDQGLGFLFGMLRGVLLILAALVAYAFFEADFPIVNESKTVELLAETQVKIQDMIQRDYEAGKEGVYAWGQSKYTELTTTCSANAAKDDLPKVTGN
ncbi:colicin V production protein CvpA [Amylibacter marinus]|uniref:Colicin V production protein CvpA n=1 Tax=Amylibacter marinus TaxID=1475483 RepID=A0ABQ5VRJ4_9RHOB|nr:CvpA family protein [Amylibacter marinus]GLQ33896.1 colicin V production protein CvpA [Amylibacter marinus]